MRLLVTVLIAAVYAQAQPPPQGPPDTDIYLVKLTDANGRISVGAPTNITDNPGYDNQPFFTPDGHSILFSSQRGASPATRDNPRAPQTDIYRYDIGTRAIMRVTRTPESEYSPTVMPDGKRISVVRVESDGAQRLWSIMPSGPAIQLDLLLPDVKPVGYHAWADDHTVALFVLGGNGAAATLQLADTRTGSARIVATDVGRSIQRMPGTTVGRRISFVQREHEGEKVRLVVMALDAASGAIARVTPAVEGSSEADLAWLPDGTLLMVANDVLYAWRDGRAGWQTVAELSPLSLRGATRLAASPDGRMLAIVAAGARPTGI